MIQMWWRLRRPSVYAVLRQSAPKMSGIVACASDCMKVAGCVVDAYTTFAWIADGPHLANRHSLGFAENFEVLIRGTSCLFFAREEVGRFFVRENSLFEDLARFRHERSDESRNFVQLERKPTYLFPTFLRVSFDDLRPFNVCYFLTNSGNSQPNTVQRFY